MQSLLFVSTSLIAPAEERREIDEILSIGKRRNCALGVTGALIFTHHHFAEILEGPKPALDTLMASIRRDTRHRDIKVADTMSIEQPTFTRWAMAYHGPASYVGKRVEALLAGPAPAAAQEMRALICALAGAD